MQFFLRRAGARLATDIPFSRLTLTALLAGSVAIAAAPPDAAAALNLRQLIEIAQHDNKDLQAARYAVDIGRARLIQAGLLPNPKLDLSASSDASFKNEGEYTRSAGVSQAFPIAGRISRQKDLARVDVALAEAEVQEAERRLGGEVAVSVYRLVVIDRQIQSRNDLIGVEEKLAKAARDRLKAAEVSELDVNTVQLDVQRLSQERDLLQSQRQSLLVSVNTLIGRPASASLSIDEPLPDSELLPALEQLQSQAMRSRPDLHSALLGIDRAQAEKALAQASRWEDWSLGIGLNQDHAVIEGAPAQGSDRALGASLSIPLPLFNRNQGAIAEAQANAGQARARIEALRLAIAGEVASAHAEASNLQKLLRQYREDLLPVSARNVQLGQQGYGQGLISVFEVVQVQRQQAELNAAYLETLDQFLQALVRLRAATAEYVTFGTPRPADNGNKEVQK